MGINSNKNKFSLSSKMSSKKLFNTKKDFCNLLFEKSNAMIPLDYLEEFEEMSVNVEQVASNIIIVSECVEDSYSFI